MKEKHLEIIYYSQADIVRFIKEDKLTIWDLGEKLRIQQFRKTLLYQCLRENIKPENLVEELILTLEENTQTYLKNTSTKDEVLDYNTLLALANAKKTQYGIMKYFGIISYGYYSKLVRKIFDRIPEKKRKNLRKKIRENLKTVKVELQKDDEKEMTEELKVTGLMNVENSPTTAISPVTVTPIENVNSKLILYTYEYLENCKELEKELQEPTIEKIVLSSTISLLMKNIKISAERKKTIGDALNDPTCNFKILPNSTYYKFEKTQSGNALGCENDLTITQALMLSRYTLRDIYIATSNPYTAFNLLAMSFGVRVAKTKLNNSYFKDNDNLAYLDYKITDVPLPDNCDTDKIFVIDTCVLLATDSNQHHDNINKVKQLLLSTDEIKLIPKVVLEELRDVYHYSFVLDCLKHNPTLKLEFETSFRYLYDDFRLLNFVMHYQNRHPEKDVTIITYDYTFYLEALQYHIKAQYIDYISKKVVKEDAPNTGKSLTIFKSDNSFATLKTKNLVSVLEAGTRKEKNFFRQKNMIYFKIKINDLVRFANDPLTYRIISITNNTAKLEIDF